MMAWKGSPHGDHERLPPRSDAPLGRQPHQNRPLWQRQRRHCDLIWRDLIRRDQERQEQIAQFRSLIDEGPASGLSPRSIAEVLQEARTRAGITGRDDVQNHTPR